MEIYNVKDQAKGAEPSTETVNVAPAGAPQAEANPAPAKKVVEHHHGENNFFKSAFTSYLTITLCVFAFFFFALQQFITVISYSNVVSWFNLFAILTAVAAFVVYAVKCIKNQKVEFNPELVIVALTLFCIASSAVGPMSVLF